MRKQRRSAASHVVGDGARRTTFMADGAYISVPTRSSRWSGAAGRAAASDRAPRLWVAGFGSGRSGLRKSFRRIGGSVQALSGILRKDSSGETCPAENRSEGFTRGVHALPGFPRRDSIEALGPTDGRSEGFTMTGSPFRRLFGRNGHRRDWSWERGRTWISAGIGLLGHVIVSLRISISARRHA